MPEVRLHGTNRCCSGAGIESEPHVCRGRAVSFFFIVDVAVGASQFASDVSDLKRCPDYGAKDIERFRFRPFFADSSTPQQSSDPCPKCGAVPFVENVGIWD